MAGLCVHSVECYLGGDVAVAGGATPPAGLFPAGFSLPGVLPAGGVAAGVVPDGLLSAGVVPPAGVTSIAGVVWMGGCVGSVTAGCVGTAVGSATLVIIVASPFLAVSQ